MRQQLLKKLMEQDYSTEPERVPITGFQPDHTNERTLASPAAQLPAIIRYREATEEKVKAGVLKRIPQMVRQYFGYDPMPFHVRDIERMFEGGRIANLRPTEHGKSTNGNVVFPLLSLANDENSAHGIVCVNQEESGRWLRQIQIFLESNADFVRDYPWCAKPKRGSGKPWNAREITVDGRTQVQNANPSVYATARGDRSIKSRRFKGSYDDIEGLGTVTELERIKLWDWGAQEAWRTFEDANFASRPLWMWQGTPFDIDSVYFRLEELAGVEVSRLPYRYPADHPRYPSQYIWPAKKDKVLEFRRTRDPKIFAIAMELDPRAGDTEQWAYSEIITMGHRLHAATMQQPRIFVSIDPAGGSKRRGADYAGISVVRIEWQKGWELPVCELLYAEAFRGGLYEQSDRAAYLAEFYKAPIICEGNSQQRFTYTEVFQNRHPECEIVIFMTTEEAKRDTKLGLSVIKTLLRFGRFHTIEPLGQDTDEGMRAFRREVRDLGISKHDHICKSVWFVIRHVYQGTRQAARIKMVGPRPQVHSPFGSGNLSRRVMIQR